MRKLFLLGAMLGGLFLNAQTVTTFAGSTSKGSLEGTGTNASFNFPSGIAVDPSGNLYIGDQVNHKIRKITPAGTVTTFAGSGTQGSADGTVTSAQFKLPIGVACDAAGNVYVADYGNNKIRKITPSGVVSTLAGSGLAGSANGTGTAASFRVPLGVAVDGSGNVYVADYDNHLIRKITPSGVVTTFAGSGAAGSTDGTGTAASFRSPSGLTLDALGNIFVADYGNHKIRKIDPSGEVTTFAGSGTAGSADGTGTAASFRNPYSLGCDNAQNLYIADFNNHLIRMITPSGVVTRYAGDGTAGSTNGTGTSARFNQPIAAASDASNNLFVVDYGNHLIRKISPGTLSATASKKTKPLVYFDAASSKLRLVSGNAVFGAYKIYDASGKLVQKGIEKTKELSFTPSKGFYILVYSLLGENASFRFVK